jgi:hypothetical protein
MGGMKNAHKFQSEDMKGRNRLGDPGVSKSNQIVCILKIGRKH